jgi:glycosyltransferase involved in cell wall biosynthesis
VNPRHFICTIRSKKLSTARLTAASAGTGREGERTSLRTAPDITARRVEVHSSPQSVAYLVNQYPAISHTFIRREIEALERAGVTITRFSVRRSTQQLITPADKEEAERTTVLLDSGAVGMARAVVRTCLGNPLRFLRALGLTLGSGWRSERGLLIHLVYLAEACLLLGQLQRRGLRHVHAHFGTNSATVAMLCHTLGGTSYSFTAHGPEEFDKAELWHLGDKIKRAAFVVAVSSYGRSQLYRHCPREQWPKIELVHCGVDDSFLEAAPSPVPVAPRLVSVARFAEQKGLSLLLEALGELHRRGRPFELTLVGDGELRGEVERAITRLDLGRKVHLAGWADESTVRQLIQQARALVLPSFAEGLPVVIMEALALGRPVVTTYVGGIPELVTPNRCGWLVPAGSQEDLVAALEEVLASPPEVLAALGAVGRERVRANHEMGRIGEQMGSLMKRWA